MFKTVNEIRAYQDQIQQALVTVCSGNALAQHTEITITELNKHLVIKNSAINQSTIIVQLRSIPVPLEGGIGRDSFIARVCGGTPWFFGYSQGEDNVITAQSLEHVTNLIILTLIHQFVYDSPVLLTTPVIKCLITTKEFAGITIQETENSLHIRVVDHENKFIWESSFTNNTSVIETETMSQFSLRPLQDAVFWALAMNQQNWDYQLEQPPVFNLS